MKYRTPPLDTRAASSGPPAAPAVQPQVAAQRPAPAVKPNALPRKAMHPRGKNRGMF